MSDTGSFADDLDPTARRRLWFLQQIIESRGIEDVEATLDFAEKLEEFILRGRRHPSTQDGCAGQSHADFETKNAGSLVEKRSQLVTDTTRPPVDDKRGGNTLSTARSVSSNITVGNVSAPLQPARQARRTAIKRALAENPVLSPAMRDRFIDEAARNPDNRHLADLFGLTVRQAHAARVAFRHRIARVASTRAPGT
jgi:hypothetical protein